MTSIFSPFTRWWSRVPAKLKPVLEGFGVFCLMLVLAAAINSHIISAPSNLSPGAVDQMGHLTRVWYLGEALLNEKVLPAWFPYWYCGVASYQYYPPLPSVFMTLAYLVLRNVMNVYKVTVLCFSAFAGLGAYLCGRKLGCRVCGLLAGVMFAFHPYNIFTLNYMGNFAQAIVGVISPFALLAAFNCFQKKPRPGKWILGCLVWALMILGHPMCAAVVALGIGAIAVVFSLREGNASYLGIWVSTVVLGLFISGFWTLPGVTPFENPDIPFLLPERAAAWSVSWYIFNPAQKWASLYDRYFGFWATLLAIGGVVAFYRIKEKRPCGIALGTSLFVCLALSFGINLPFWRVIPLNSQIVPDRILNFAALLQSVLAAFFTVQLGRWVGRLAKGPSSKTAAAIALGLVLRLVVLDVLPYFRCGGVQDHALFEKMLDKVPLEGKNPFAQGRMSILAYEFLSAANYFPPTRGIGLIDGWNQEGTPHQKSMVEQNIAARYGLWGSHLRNHALRNVRTVMVRESGDPNLVSAFKDFGFVQSYREPGGLSIFVLDEPSTYAFDMTGTMLVTGKGTLWATSVLPWAGDAKQDCLLKNQEKYLDEFETIFLCEVEREKVERIEEAVLSMVSGGKTIIIDLSNSHVTSLVGVTKREIAISGDVLFSGTPGSPYGFTTVQNVTRSDGEPLRGASYDGLDGVWLSVEVDGFERPIVGYKELQQGRVYFLGLGSTRSIADTGNQGLSVLFEPLFDTLDLRKTVTPPAFPIKNLDWDYSGVSFSYDSDEDKPVLLSITYTPRWTLLVDGVKTQVFDHENFVFFRAPAGSHQVTLVYGMTWVGIAGIAITALGLGVLVAVAWVWSRRFSLRQQKETPPMEVEI